MGRVEEDAAHHFAHQYKGEGTVGHGGNSLLASGHTGVAIEVGSQEPSAYKDQKQAQNKSLEVRPDHERQALQSSRTLGGEVSHVDGQNEELDAQENDCAEGDALDDRADERSLLLRDLGIPVG